MTGRMPATTPNARRVSHHRADRRLSPKAGRAGNRDCGSRQMHPSRGALHPIRGVCGGPRPVVHPIRVRSAHAAGANRQPVPARAPPGRNSHRRSAFPRQPRRRAPAAGPGIRTCVRDRCPAAGRPAPRTPARDVASPASRPVRQRRSRPRRGPGVDRSDLPQRCGETLRSTAAEAACWALRGQGGRTRRPPHRHRPRTPRRIPKDDRTPGMPPQARAVRHPGTEACPITGARADGPFETGST